MPFMHRLKTLWRNLARKRKVENELDDEIRSYRQLLEDEKTGAGADPGSAHRDAMLETGGVEQIKEGVREVRLGSSLEAIGSELRQAWRGLRRNPGIACLGALMLALGMGASTVVFSIFHAALIQPLPFRDTARLFGLDETRLPRGIDRAAFSEANFWDVRAQNRSFEEVAAYHYGEATLTGDGPAEKVTASIITSGFLRTLGVSPVLGRDFSYDDDRGGMNATVAILGNKFWKSHFAADPNVLGKTLRVNDRAYTVVGVLPPGQPWIDDQIYTPFGYRPDAERGSWEFTVVARLKPGVTLSQARADLARIAGVLGPEYPKIDKGIGFRMEPSSGWVATPTTRRALWVLLGAVTFLLLIACLNVANLLLARGTARRREIAVRTALGAGRMRLIRFVIMEALILSTAGCVLGLALAGGALRVIRTLQIEALPRIADARLNLWVLGFAAGIALLTGILSGLAPALQAPLSGITAVLRDGDRQTGSRSQGRLRAMLVTGEVALSFLLLAGAGLLIRSFTQLLNENRGFHTDHRLLFSLSFPPSYWEHGIGKPFLDRLFARLSATPGVIAVGAVNTRPAEGWDPGMNIDSAVRPRGAGESAAPWAGWRIVSPGYFHAIGLPLLSGRAFDSNDQPVWEAPGQPPPHRRVIISRSVAKRLFPNEDPVGQPVILWKGQSNHEAEVVGVVGDSRERGLASDPTLTVYLPWGRVALTSEVVVHTQGDPLALARSARAIVAGLDPNVPVSEVRTFDEVMARSVSPERFNVVLMGIFSGLALLLATSGLYGVLSYSVGQRTSEIGLRVALGATAGRILRMTVVEGMKPAIAGVLLGALGAFWLSRYFATLLFQIKPFDLPTYALVTVLLLATASAACLVPGRRAMRTDPAVALRLE